MALTAKPIATITYNTREFLINKLDELFKANIIEKYYAIYHDKDILVKTGELKKAHFHLWLQPNKKIDTMALAKEFTQVDPNSDKPFKCRPFEKSQLYHWLRYTIHDPVYLQLHNDDNDGRQEYKITDYIAFDNDILLEDYEQSAQVIELNKTQQRDKLAEYIINSDEQLDINMLYQIALKQNLADGYWGFQNALKSMIYDHNKSLYYQQDIEHVLDKQLVTDINRVSFKLDEVDITGYAKITDNKGQKYTIYKDEPNKSQHKEDIWKSTN